MGSVHRLEGLAACVALTSAVGWRARVALGTAARRGQATTTLNPLSGCGTAWPDSEDAGPTEAADRGPVAQQRIRAHESCDDAYAGTALPIAGTPSDGHS